MSSGIELRPSVKKFADKLLSDPKITPPQAYIDTHMTNNRNSARVQAHKTLMKSNVQIYMEKHADKAKQRVVELIGSKKEDIALKASVEILDRTYGKSVQRQVNENTNLNINLQASKELADKFTEFMRSNTAT